MSSPYGAASEGVKDAAVTGTARCRPRQRARYEPGVL